MKCLLPNGVDELCLPPLWWGDILYLSCPSVRLSVCLSVSLSVTQFVSATPLKLLNRISWNLVGSKDTIQYTPSVSTIILSGQTYSSQNVRQIWESTLSKSDYLVGHHGRTWEWIFKDLFTFLEVNMSNILWSMRICKRTFFPVCRMIEVFAKISSKITPRTPYSCQEG
jgi:hypothetical protein